MRLGKVGKQLQPIRDLIEQERVSGQISTRHSQKLENELFSVFALATPPGERLTAFCAARRGFRQRLARVIELTRHEHPLPQALHALYVKGCAPRNGLDRFRAIQPSDWNLTHDLADALGRNLKAELTAMATRRPAPPDWMVRAEADFEEVEVHVEPAALEAMILSVYETYKVPRSTRGPGFTETYGVCFGTKSTRSEYRRSRGQMEIVTIHLQRAVPQIRARVTSDSVSPDMRSTGLFLEVGKRLFRHCEIVGEFHSHPYRNLTELKNAGGWNHSREDQDYVRVQFDAWRKLKQSPRVFIICAVARGKSTANDQLAARKPNLFALHLSACRFYLAAYRILPNGDLVENGVTLHCCGNLGARP